MDQNVKKGKKCNKIQNGQNVIFLKGQKSENSKRSTISKKKIKR